MYAIIDSQTGLRRPIMKLHTVIVPLANAYIELCCIDPWMAEAKRHWVIRQTVDYSRICLQ